MDLSLIGNWLSREGGDVLSWWLLVTLAGAAAWPLLFRVLGGLPDRGYTLARAAGLMLTGFAFWFLASLGLLRNTPGGIVFAWVLVLAVGLAAFLRWDQRPPLRDWWREHAALVIVTEIAFLLLLFGWAIVRAHHNEVYSTEKPMEVMLLNAIRRSETFPPHDAWLSGYAISYYYFGYVIMAMLAEVSDVSSGIAFGTTIALLAALAGIGALGVVYNMIRARGPRGVFRPGSRSAALIAGALGLCFVVFMGNLGTALIEFPYRGYAGGLVGGAYFDFFDVEGRGSATEYTPSSGSVTRAIPDRDGDGIPDWDDDPLPLDRWSFWETAGWRYSRTIQDRDLSGQPVGIQPIAEFPDFSFVLADVHPHVLALPFAMLVLGLALNLVLAARDPRLAEIPLYAIVAGGMMFMNSWDAIYLPLIIAAEVLGRLVRGGTGTLSWADLLKSARFALLVIALSLVAYLPWLISFTSQASGILPNVIFPTRYSQFFLQFGPFLVILTVFLIVEVRRAGRRFHWQAGLLALVMVLSILILVLAVLGVRVWNDPNVRGAVYAAVNQSGGLGDALPDVLARRLIGLPSELLLLLMIVAVVGRLFARRAARDPGDDSAPRLPYSPATAFALLLVAAGAVLTLAPDFVYLRDNFGMRMNTVFKLYYQGWVMFSLASAFAVWSVLRGGDRRAGQPAPAADSPARLAGRTVFGAAVVLLVAAGMLYPLVSIRGRAMLDRQRVLGDKSRLALNQEIAACEAQNDSGITCPNKPPLSLDGTPTMVSSGDYTAAQCLDRLVPGDQAVLIEAPCNCGYQPQYGRFATLTGIPTLMGWGNHEGQWRGDTLRDVTDARVENGEYRDRFVDARELYTTQDWARVWATIDRYGIDYIVVGPSERQMVSDLAGGDASKLREYTQGLEKFAQVLTPVCEANSVVVYRVRPN